VEMRVFDVHGAVVRRLASGPLEPGWHTVEWDGRDDAGRRAGSGIYFVRMTAGGRHHQLRLALVR